jgi:hypothetical protein
MAMEGREQYPEKQKPIEELKEMGIIKHVSHHCFPIKARELE